MARDTPWLLLYNAEILTLDAEDSRYEALLCRNGRVECVGTSDDIFKRAPSEVIKLDLGGATVVPGFNDNHLHAVILGTRTAFPNLRFLDEQEIVALLAEQYRNVKPGELIYAFGWDYTHCLNPHRSILDGVFPNNPVVLIQFSGHGMWVNSKALKKMKIGRDSPEPRHGTILRETDGEPTGVLRDAHGSRFMRKNFWRSHYHRKTNLRYLTIALEQFRKVGLTSVQDNTWFFPTVRNLNRLKKAGHLTCRFSCWRYGQNRRFSLFMGVQKYDPLWFRRGPIKYLLDGAFSSRSAWLTEPYADDPNNSGTGRDRREIRKFLIPTVKRGGQAAFHAIGDRSVKEFLDTLEELAEAYPDIRRLRLRIEHAQLIRPEDVPRIRDLGILVAAQPAALSNPDKDRELLGEKRATRAYPYRALLDAGIHLSFGTDAPAEDSLSPLDGIHLAVNRSGSQHITAAEALRCYTRESAYAEFMEEKKGSIEPGKLADFTVLSANPLTVDPRQIKEIQVLMTIVDGAVVYDVANQELT